MNARMSDLLEGFELHAREEDVPDQFRAVVRAGWTADGDAQLLTALHSGYSGGGRQDFEDVIHYEASVNGRGMMDYDLPGSGPERLDTLLRRCLGYACTVLDSVAEGQKCPVRSYVSLSEGGLDDDLLTAHVTFCSDHPDLPRYVDDLDAYGQEALLELSQDDAAALLVR
ncbi:hypothetical protein ACIBL8_25900 [Streptomyces sp. NPDC050523]|uniref:hypothetical protein n=1 Tax=Streptomyces sp. NPDC050523 TaxID=3365622 RepID=UPI0037986310